MAWVRLKINWGASFSRSVRDGTGAVAKRLTFKPGEPTEVYGDELAAVRDDVGKALQAVNFNPQTKRFDVVDLADWQQSEQPPPAAAELPADSAASKPAAAPPVEVTADPAATAPAAPAAETAPAAGAPASVPPLEDLVNASKNVGKKK